MAFTVDREPLAWREILALSVFAVLLLGALPLYAWERVRRP
jgi:hypothetical protein